MNVPKRGVTDKSSVKSDKKLYLSYKVKSSNS